MEEKRIYVQIPKFTERNVPICDLAKAIGKDAQYIHIGLQQEILHFCLT